MRFQLAGQVFRPEIVDAATDISRSTGRELRRLTIRFQTRSAADRHRVDASPPGTTLATVDEDPPRQWRKVGVSSSIGDSSSWVHTWEVEEMEQIAVEALLLNDLRVVPSRYAENWLGDRLEIHALVTLTPDENRILKKLAASDDAVAVVRVGISPETRMMLVHDGPWSQNDGSFQWLLHLSDSDDADRQPSAGALVLGRRHHAVPYLLEYLDGITSLLISKGVINEEDRKSVKDRALERSRERAIGMLAVDNVEDYWDEADFSR